MKNLFSILLVSILLFGCSNDDTISEITPTTIDENLVGVWRWNNSTSSSSSYFYHDYVVLTFSNNGKFSRSFHNYTGSPSDNSPDFEGVEETFGDYWIEDNLLIMSFGNEAGGYVYEYNVTAYFNQLSLKTSEYTEPRIYLKQ
ncbi:MAG: hypothetical protein ACPHL8_01920 [Flavobacteriales bacterium]